MWFRNVSLIRLESKHIFTLRVQYIKKKLQNDYNRDAFTTNYFYDVFLKQKFQTLIIQTKSRNLT